MTAALGRRVEIGTRCRDRHVRLPISAADADLGRDCRSRPWVPIGAVPRGRRRHPGTTKGADRAVGALR
ncbi:MAG: hypothetical protein ACI38P_01895, partial [Cellulosimicrobium funkei]